jgi:hypothetical protein
MRYGKMCFVIRMLRLHKDSYVMVHDEEEKQKYPEDLRDRVLTPMELETLRIMWRVKK